MIIAQCFVEFIFYSFLGWVWESIYCTINEKKWADRGFLFGPICPIYGSCVVAVSLLFSIIPALSNPKLPLWVIFVICYIGSAIAEFGTSWVLEKRFHARWWDYSDMPLNIQGRICVPVSIAFGIAGVLIVKFLIPAINNMHLVIHPLVYEFLAIILAMVFGADFALTEASLSALLKNVEDVHKAFVDKAQFNYEKLVATPEVISQRMHAEATSIEQRVEKEKAVMEAKISDMQKALSDMQISAFSFNQRRILESISRFTPDKKKTGAHNADHILLMNELKKFIRAEALRKKRDKNNSNMQG